MNRKYIKYANKNNNKNNSKNNIKKDIVKQESLFPEIAQENDELFDIDAVPFNEVVEEKVDNFSNDNVIELAIEDENVDLENLDFTLIIEKKVNLKI
jgi:hypothetical protein